MWALTRSEWPVLVNLDRAATIGYQQVAKFEARTRVIAAAWEEEYVLADCADADQARGLVAAIARALADGQRLLDLRDLDLESIGAEFAALGRR
jgi:hypothetical protein